MINKCMSLVAASALTLTTACGYNAAGEPRYCEANPEVCAIAGAVIVGGIVAMASDSSSSGAGGGGAGGGGGFGGGGFGGGGLLSDDRLKTDVRKVAELPNGLNLYAFKYIGDSRSFVGVRAQELLDDPRYRDAVVRRSDGYLAVDYGRLPVNTIGMEQMKAAGRAAVSLG